MILLLLKFDNLIKEKYRKRKIIFAKYVVKSKICQWLRSKIQNNEL